MAAMSGELLVMSTRDLDRLEVIKQAVEGRIKSSVAADLLGLCRKQGHAAVPGV
jgi:hypothetical protein